MLKKFVQQGRSERLKMILSKLARVRCPWDGSDESATARVQRGPSEGARCASTGDSPAIPSPAGGLFQHPARTGPSPLLFLRQSQDRLEDGICVQHCLQRFCPDEELPDVRSL